METTTRPAKRTMGRRSFEKLSIQRLINYETLRDRDMEYNIQMMVTKFFSVSLDKVLSSTRKQEVVHARHIIMYLYHKVAKYPMEMIGHLMNRDHSSISGAIKGVNDLIETYPKYRENMELLRNLLRDEEPVKKTPTTDTYFQKTMTKSFEYTYSKYVY